MFLADRPLTLWLNSQADVTHSGWLAWVVASRTWFDVAKQIDATLLNIARPFLEEDASGQNYRGAVRLRASRISGGTVSEAARQRSCQSTGGSAPLRMFVLRQAASDLTLHRIRDYHQHQALNLDDLCGNLPGQDYRRRPASPDTAAARHVSWSQVHTSGCLRPVRALMPAMASAAAASGASASSQSRSRHDSSAS